MKITVFFAMLFLSLKSYAYPAKVYGVLPSSLGVEFAVESGGCTDKTNFIVSTSLVSSEGDLSPIYEVSLVQRQADRCTAVMPFGEKIFYSWDELKVPKNSMFQFRGLDPVLRTE